MQVAGSIENVANCMREEGAIVQEQNWNWE